MAYSIIRTALLTIFKLLSIVIKGTTDTLKVLSSIRVSILKLISKLIKNIWNRLFVNSKLLNEYTEHLKSSKWSSLWSLLNQKKPNLRAKLRPNIAISTDCAAYILHTANIPESSESESEEETEFKRIEEKEGTEKSEETREREESMEIDLKKESEHSNESAIVQRQGKNQPEATEKYEAINPFKRKTNESIACLNKRKKSEDVGVEGTEDPNSRIRSVDKASSRTFTDKGIQCTLIWPTADTHTKTGPRCKFEEQQPSESGTGESVATDPVKADIQSQTIDSETGDSNVSPMEQSSISVTEPPIKIVGVSSLGGCSRGKLDDTNSSLATENLGTSDNKKTAAETVRVLSLSKLEGFGIPPQESSFQISNHSDSSEPDSTDYDSAAESILEKIKEGSIPKAKFQIEENPEEAQNPEGSQSRYEFYELQKKKPKLKDLIDRIEMDAEAIKITNITDMNDTKNLESWRKKLASDSSDITESSDNCRNSARSHQNKNVIASVSPIRRREPVQGEFKRPTGKAISTLVTNRSSSRKGNSRPVSSRFRSPSGQGGSRPDSSRSRSPSGQGGSKAVSSSPKSPSGQGSSRAVSSRSRRSSGEARFQNTGNERLIHHTSIQVVLEMSLEKLLGVESQQRAESLLFSGDLPVTYLGVSSRESGKPKASTSSLPRSPRCHPSSGDAGSDHLLPNIGLKISDSAETTETDQCPNSEKNKQTEVSEIASGTYKQKLSQVGENNPLSAMESEHLSPVQENQSLEIGEQTTNELCLEESRALGSCPEQILKSTESDSDLELIGDSLLPSSHRGTGHAAKSEFTEQDASMSTDVSNTAQIACDETSDFLNIPSNTPSDTQGLVETSKSGSVIREKENTEAGIPKIINPKRRKDETEESLEDLDHKTKSFKIEHEKVESNIQGKCESLEASETPETKQDTDSALKLKCKRTYSDLQHNTSSEEISESCIKMREEAPTSASLTDEPQKRAKIEHEQDVDESKSESTSIDKESNNSQGKQTDTFHEKDILEQPCDDEEISKTMLISSEKKTGESSSYAQDDKITPVMECETAESSDVEYEAKSELSKNKNVSQSLNLGQVCSTQQDLELEDEKYELDENKTGECTPINLVKDPKILNSEHAPRESLPDFTPEIKENMDIINETTEQTDCMEVDLNDSKGTLELKDSTNEDLELKRIFMQALDLTVISGKSSASGENEMDASNESGMSERHLDTPNKVGKWLDPLDLARELKGSRNRAKPKTYLKPCKSRYTVSEEGYIADNESVEEEDCESNSDKDLSVTASREERSDSQTSPHDERSDKTAANASNISRTLETLSECETESCNKTAEQISQRNGNDNQNSKSGTETQTGNNQKQTSLKDQDDGVRNECLSSPHDAKICDTQKAPEYSENTSKANLPVVPVDESELNQADSKDIPYSQDGSLLPQCLVSSISEQEMPENDTKDESPLEQQMSEEANDNPDVTEISQSSESEQRDFKEDKIENN